MPLLSNPAGLWALLALPVVVLIHFLQEKSRKVRASTLFLLERVNPESAHGARFERLRNSLPLWLQLLAAALITWMLCEPRWIKEDSKQTIVVLLDSSVSMSPFKAPTRDALAVKLRAWSRSSAQTDWHLLESNPRKPALYKGADLSGLLSAYDQWEPTMGTHVPDDAMLTARGLVKGNGIVIYVTDRKAAVPSDVAVLSIGENIENVGFAGIEASLVNEASGTGSGTHWKTLIKNYSNKPQTREWWVEDAASEDHKTTSSKQQITLEPGQTMAIKGELPPDAERAVLVLSGDRFAWDDRLPLQKPQPRTVNVDIRVGGRSKDVLQKMLSALDHVSLNAGSSPADLVVSEIGDAVDTNAVQIAGSSEETKLDAAYTVAEEHPLTRDLNWMGLLTGKPLELTVTDNDAPLLWKADRVLALLRRDINTAGLPTRRLILGWDITASNAARHPALLIMLQRFVESVRESKRDPWAGNFETGQRLDVSTQQGVAPVRVTMHSAGKSSGPAERTPEHPGFFEISIDGKPFINGAAAFADTREADFTDATPIDTVDARRWEAAMKQTEADPWMPLWVLVVLGCLLASWAPIGSRFKASGSRNDAMKTARA